jgi:hypothetical protein
VAVDSPAGVVVEVRQDQPLGRVKCSLPN